MSTLGIATLDTRVDLGGLDKGLNKAKGRTSKAFSGLGKNLGKIGGAAIVGGIGLAAGAIGGLAFAFRDAASLARTQRDAERQLNAVIESTGGAAGLTADQVKDMASGLQDVTNFGDEAIIGGQNLLLTFKNIGEDVFPQVTETMLDVSTAMGQDINQSAIQLGKALNDPITGMTSLRRVGITFTESQEEQIKALQESGDLMGAQTIILEELESQFGGSAEAMADPAIQAKNAWGDFKEQIGSVLLIIQGALGRAALPLIQSAMERIGPVVDVAAEAFNKLIEGLLSGEDPIGDIANFVFTMAEAMGASRERATGLFNAVIGLRNMIGTLRERISSTLGPIVDAITQFVSWKDVLITLGIAIAAFIIPIIVSIASALLPVIATFAIVAGAVALLRNAWENNWGGIQEKVQAVIDFVVPLVRGAVDDIRTFWAENGAAIIARVQEAWSQIQVAINTAVFRVRAIIANVLGTIETFWDQHGTMIIATILTAWTVIKATISSAIAVIRPAITQFVANAREALASFGPAIEDLKALWDSLKPVIAVVAAVIGAVVLAAVGIAVGALKGLSLAVGPVIRAFTGMVSLVANLLRSFVTGLTNTFKIIVALIQGDTDRAKEIWRDNWNETLGIIKQIGQDIKQVVSGLVEAVTGFISGLVSGVVGFFTNLHNTLVGGSIIPEMVAAITGIISDFVSAFKEKVSGLVDSVISFFGDMWDAVKGAFETAKTVLLEKATAIKDSILEAIDVAAEFATVGVNLITSLANALWNRATTYLKSKAQGVASLLPTWVKELLGIASESRVFHEIGFNVGTGLASGILATESEVKRAVDQIMKTAMDPGDGRLIPFRASVDGSGVLMGAPAGGTRVSKRNQTNNFTLIQNSNAPTRSSAGEFELMKARVGGI